MGSTRSALAASGKTFRTKGISRRVNQINISAIKEMPLIASKVPGCVSLGQGIPSFPTPPHIVESVCRAMRDLPDSGKYTLGPGMPELREAIARRLLVERGLSVDPDGGNLRHGGRHGGFVRSRSHSCGPRVTK